MGLRVSKISLLYHSLTDPIPFLYIISERKSRQAWAWLFAYKMRGDLISSKRDWGAKIKIIEITEKIDF